VRWAVAGGAQVSNEPAYDLHSTRQENAVAPTDAFRIASVAALREQIGEPNPATHQKIFDHLDEQMRAYLSRSPFCLMATTDREGMPEVSP